MINQYSHSVCEKFQTTIRAKVSPVNLIYGATFLLRKPHNYKVSLKMGNFVEFTKNIYKN